MFLRIVFYGLAGIFLLVFIFLAWVILFWTDPDDHEKDEEDGYCFEDEEDTDEYERAA